MRTGWAPALAPAQVELPPAGGASGAPRPVSPTRVTKGGARGLTGGALRLPVASSLPTLSFSVFVCKLA